MYNFSQRSRSAVGYVTIVCPRRQVVAGGAGGADPAADVLVRLARGAAGFGFRIVGGTEDGSRVAVGYVVPGTRSAHPIASN